MTKAELPTLRDIELAEERVRNYIPPTPLVRSKGISDLLGREVYLKLESFQPVRVFKIRGALNKLLTLPDSDLKRGVLTASSGNHGFAIAYAARLFGVKATICVPENVNPQKLRAIVGEGAEVIRRGRGYDETYKYALATASKRGLTFVHAFDDPAIIAGQGTCGFEIARQLPDVDSTIVAIGGGGLISGVSIALRSLLEKTRIYGAETDAIPSMYDSLRSGRRVHVRPRKTIADGMQAATPGELTFQAATRYLERVVLVTDRQIEDAIYDLLTIGGVLAEPAGASPLAALRGPLSSEGAAKTVLVVSGSNISLELLASILARRSKGTPGGPSPSETGSTASLPPGSSRGPPRSRGRGRRPSPRGV